MHAGVRTCAPEAGRACAFAPAILRPLFARFRRCASCGCVVRGRVACTRHRADARRRDCPKPQRLAGERHAAFFQREGLCAACTPLAFFGIVGKGGGSGRRRTICAVGQGGGIAAAPVRPCAFCPAAFRILRRGLLHKALAQISPLSILKIYSTTSGETGTHGPVVCPAAVEIVRDHSGAAIGI